MKTTRRALILIGSFLLLAVLVVTLLYFSGRREELGVLQAKENRFEFENEEIQVHFLPSNSDSVFQPKIKIYSLKPPGEKRPGIAFESARAFQISGKRSDLCGTVHIMFPFPESLPASELAALEIAEKLFVVAALKNCISSPQNQKETQVFLPAHINFDEQTISTKFSLEKPVAETGGEEFEIAIFLRFYEQEVNYVPSQPPAGKNPAFEAMVDFDSSEIYMENLRALLAELESQRAKLNSLGFSFKGAPYPIPVFLSFSEQEQMPYFRFNRHLPGQKALIVPVSPFLDKKMKRWSDQQDQLTRACGRELLRLSLSLYRQPDWLHEALAAWYEPVAASQPAFMPQRVAENVNILETPIIFPELRQNHSAANHGYGSACFFSFLSQNQGALFGCRLFNAFRRKPEMTLKQAIEKAAFDKDFRNLYLLFLDTYVRSPESLFPALSRSEIDKHLAHDKISATIGGSSNLSIDWDTDELPQAQSLRTKDEDFALVYELPNLTAQTLKLGFFLKKGSERQLLYESGRALEVEVQGDENTGILIYNDIDEKLSPVGGSLRLVAAGKKMRIGVHDLSSLFIVVANYDDTARLETKKISIHFSFSPKKQEL